MLKMMMTKIFIKNYLFPQKIPMFNSRIHGNFLRNQISSMNLLKLKLKYFKIKKNNIISQLINRNKN